ncbi:Mitotic spindle checkpoint component mad2, partial [Coemansia sp. RSA 2703]
MSVQTQLTKGKINLKGSARIVTEFFNYGINSILFQRGIYPVEDFEVKKKYGLDMWVTNDISVAQYLSKIMTAVEQWLAQGAINKLVLAVNARDTRETLERWQFDITVTDEQGGDDQKPAKSEKALQMEMQAIFRQIAASVSFLPIIEDKCTFNILVYADEGAE